MLSSRGCLIYHIVTLIRVFKIFYHDVIYLFTLPLMSLFFSLLTTTFIGFLGIAKSCFFPWTIFLACYASCQLFSSFDDCSVHLPPFILYVPFLWPQKELIAKFLNMKNTPISKYVHLKCILVVPIHLCSMYIQIIGFHTDVPCSVSH